MHNKKGNNKDQKWPNQEKKPEQNQHQHQHGKPQGECSQCDAEQKKKRHNY